MRVVRFGAEVSVPIDAHGSRFRIGPLTGDDARVRVQLVYLEPGGLIARHHADERQLLAVVAGAGWASGADEERRALHTGWGALFEPGESHETGTEDGLTAVCVEGRFESWAYAVTRELVVAEPDAAWPEWFERIRRHVWPAVEGVAVRIDHVGSTSVPNLAAKPVVDADVVVATEADVRAGIDALRAAGYRWRGDLGVEGRQAFSPFSAEALALPAHHLYLVVEGNRAHLDHTLLRDLLAEDPDAARAYGALKRRNAALAAGDVDVYVAAKAALVAELLARARAARGLAPVEYWRPDDR